VKREQRSPTRKGAQTRNHFHAKGGLRKREGERLKSGRKGTKLGDRKNGKKRDFGRA